MTNRSRRFGIPIKTPNGKTLRTLKDAAEYVLALRRPSRIGNVPHVS